MSPLDSFWTGVMSLLTPLVTPDWGKLVALIPLALLALVLLYLALLVRAWARWSASQPVRWPRMRARRLGSTVAVHAIVVAIGLAAALLAFIAGSRDPDWNGGNSPLGLVVNVPLLLLGLGLAVGTAGHGVRLWERGGRDDVEPDALDRMAAAVARHPTRAKRATVFIAGVMIATTGMLLGVVPGYTGGDPEPMAVIPVLLLGLAMAVGSVGSTIASMWTHDPDWDESPADDTSALVASRH